MNDNHIADEREPIYQLQMLGDAWADVDKEEFDLKAGNNPQWARIVYAALAPRADADTAGAKPQTDAEALYDAWQSTIAYMDEQRSATPASSVADAAGVSDAKLDKLFFWMCTNYKTEGLRGFKEKARELFAAGASERADAEKDAALTDEQIVAIESEMFPDGVGFYEGDFIKFARAILAANGEKK